MTGDGQDVERGAAEEGAQSPLTETEVEASRRPPSQPYDPRRTQPPHGQHDKTGDRPVPPDQESPYGPASRDATD